MVRDARPQEAALDRRVDRLGARAAAARRRGHRRADVPRHDVGHRQAPHRPRPRRRARRRQAAAARSGPDRARRLRRRSSSSSREELRAEGMPVGHVRRCSTRSPCSTRSRWTEPDDFREALAATMAKSPEDRRVFELVFDRFFFRAAEEAAVRRGRRRGATRRRGQRARRRRRQLDLDDAAPADRRGAARRLESRDARPRAAGDRGVRPPGRGLGGHRRRRAAHPPRARPARRAAARPRRRTTRAATGLPRDQLRRFEAAAAPRARARADRAHRSTLPPKRPLNELDRALPTGPLQDLAAVHRVVAQLKRRLKTQGQEHRGRKRRTHVDVRRTMRASLETGGVPVVIKEKPVRPRRPEIYVLCDVSTSVTSASVFFLSRAARAARLVPQDALVRVHRAHQRGHRRLRRASATSRRCPRRSGATPASPTSPATPTTAACGRSSATLVEDDLHPRATVIVLGDARTNGRDPRADIVRPDRRPGGPHLLAQPRAAAVLELRRLGDLGLRGATARPSSAGRPSSSRTSSRR